jgi:phenylpropionate dioxygenase-like ring-hydroxylating dioxygenase large terminal subunit
VETVPEQATTFPWSWYTDEAILRREQDRIFRRSWQYAGHAGEVAEPGSYFTCAAGHVPVVVTRDRSGSLNAFVNVCRHRGHPVAAGAGQRESLQCAYHAWTYDLDGGLRAAPRSDREPGFERSELGLRRVQVDTWGPFVFVNPDTGAPPLAETLRDLPELVASAGIDVDSLRFRHRAAFELEANWKIACENFLECYHCPVAHPGFSDMVDVSPDAYRLEVSETYSTQLGPLRTNGKQAYDPVGEVARSQFHFVFPNVGINIFPGRPNLSIGPINPLGATRTARFLDYFFAPDEDEAWIAELLAFDDQVSCEDRWLVEGVQRGVEAAPGEHGRLMTRSEQLIVDFQAKLSAALG